MRNALTAFAALAAFILIASPVQGQPPIFTQAFQVRGAVGDIPTTDAIEPAGTWNLEQRLVIAMGNTSVTEQRYHFAIPTGASLVNATCDCPVYSSNQTSNAVTFTIPNDGAPSHILRVTTRQPFDSTLGFSIIVPLEASHDDVAVIFYVPRDSEIDGVVALTSPGVSTDGTSTIWYATFDSDRPAPLDLWFTLHPDDGVTRAIDHEGWDDNTWLFLGLGIVAGAILWALLVNKGVVQARSRRQVTTTAAHVEAAANDSPAVLEGKKRALMAALKEVEMARQANEMPVDVYDAVKADLKKQTVTVMRALEQSGGAPPPTN